MIFSPSSQVHKEMTYRIASEERCMVPLLDNTIFQQEVVNLPQVRVEEYCWGVALRDLR